VAGLAAPRRPRAGHTTAKPPARRDLAIDSHELVAAVSNATALPAEQAERAARATIRTIVERVGGEEAAGLVAELPEELRPPKHLREAPAQDFDEAEFDRRIAQREGVTTPEAREHAREIVALLAERASDEAWAPVEVALGRFYPATLSHLREPPRFHRIKPAL
jgi:uncharacterized protein (DUF2267 family)